MNQYVSDIARLVGSRVYLLLAGSVLMVLLAHWLSPEGFGEYQLMMSLVMVLPIVVDWGISNSLPRYLAQFRGSEPGRVRPALMAGIRLKLTAMAVGSLVLVAVRGPLLEAFKLDSVAALLPAALFLLLGISLLEFFFKLSEGFQRFQAVPGVTVLRNTLDVALSLGLVLLGYGVLGALAGKLAATWLAAGVGLTWLLRPVFRDRASVSGGGTGMHRKILAYGTWLVLIDIADRVFMFGDRLLINRFLGPEMVGLYSIPARLAALLQVFGLSVASVLGPAMGSDSAEGNSALRAGLRILLAFYMLAAVVTLGLADRIVLALFGAEYAGSIPSLRVYAVIIPLMGISPVFSLVLNYRGAARVRVVLIGISALLALAGNVVLIPRMGIIGSALAMGVGMLVYVGAQGIYLSRLVSLQGFWPSLLVKLSVLSLGSVALIVLIRDLVPGTPAAWGAGALVSAGFVAALFGWGVVTAPELTSLLPKRNHRRES